MNALLHQSLHGYARGHSLIASSTKLPSDDEATVLEMSDISGSEFVGDGESYLTGYPILTAYVLARTWPAVDVPRPNAVWTHSILIPIDLVGTYDFQNVNKLFKRPVRFNALHESYATPIVFNSERVQDESDNLIDQVNIFNLVDALYLWPDSPTLALEWPSPAVEEVLWPILRRQWRSLASTFTFCTSVATVRRYKGRPFDLQFVPPLQRSRVFGVSDRNVVPYFDQRQRGTDWEKSVVPGFWTSWFGSMFGDFCRRYANDETSSRAAMPILYETQRNWTSWSGSSSYRSFNWLADLLPMPSSGLTLKHDYLNAVFEVAAKETDDERDVSLMSIVGDLISHRRGEAFGAVISEVAPAIWRSIFQSKVRAEILSMIEQRCVQPALPVAAILLQQLAKEDKLLTEITIGRYRKLLGFLIALRADLLRSPAVLQQVDAATFSASYHFFADAEARLSILKAYVSALKDDFPNVLKTADEGVDYTENLLQAFLESSQQSAVREVIARSLSISPKQSLETLLKSGAVGADIAQLQGRLVANLSSAEDRAQYIATLQAAGSAEFGLFAIAYMSSRWHDMDDVIQYQLIIDLSIGKVYPPDSSTAWREFTQYVDSYSWIPVWDRERWLAYAYAVRLKSRTQIGIDLLRTVPEFAQRVRLEAHDYQVSRAIQRALRAVTRQLD